MNIPKQITESSLPDDFTISQEEAEELWNNTKKKFKDMFDIDVKPQIYQICKYQLPCGLCDKTGELCTQIGEVKL